MWTTLANAGAWLLGKLPEGVQALLRHKRRKDQAAVGAEADAVDKRDAAADRAAEARGGEP